ncbi:hypothetical protein [Streptomyces sp. NRRL S-340]|uniref:hypothetical protein n=1 Tax=Streptomyces sp. NRRL S-340 TaxID=1463901 RepID=UPI000B0A5397|nr:hypothetical protein [Streptomyces sp. NRRL S-340]
MQEARCPAPGASLGEEAKGGLGPTVAVLVVSLAVAAVGVYELCGFGLHSLAQHPHLFNDGFATAGVIGATVAAGAAAGNLAWLLTAPRRQAATGPGRHPHTGPAEDPAHGDRGTPVTGSGIPAHDAAPGAAGTDATGRDRPPGIPAGGTPPVHHPGPAE